MAKGDIISRLKLESGEFDSKIKRAGQELLAYSEHCRKVGLQMGYANKDAKEFAKALGSMQTVSQTARGKINELSEAFVNAKVMYKNMTDAEKASPFGRTLAASLDQLKSRLNDAKKDLADVQQELNASGNKFGQFGSVIDGIGQKMGINANLTELLTSKTALMSAGIGASVAIIGKATEEWAKYNSELAKQDQITTVTTGVKGPGADRMTDQARALVDTYGVDFREAINAANTLMTQFGKSGEEAMDLIRQGMQGMIQGDGPKLLSMIQQYAPSFRDAGIEASQLVAIIQNSEGGIFTDQNMNAIVMGIKNIRLMTKATSDALAQLGIDGQKMSKDLSDGTITIFDAMKQVVDQLQKVESGSQTAGEVMQQVFGRQGTAAGTNLAKAIATLNTNLEETKRQTGEVGQSYDALYEANVKLNQAIRNCFEYDGWEQMATGIKAKLVTALADVLDVTSKIKDSWVGDVGRTIFDTMTDAALKASGPLGTVLSLLRNINSERGKGNGGNNERGKGNGGNNGGIGYSDIDKTLQYIGNGANQQERETRYDKAIAQLRQKLDNIGKERRISILEKKHDSVVNKPDTSPVEPVKPLPPTKPLPPIKPTKKTSTIAFDPNKAALAAVKAPEIEGGSETWKAMREAIAGCKEEMADFSSETNGWTKNFDPYIDNMKKMTKAAQQQQMAFNMGAEAAANLGAAFSQMEDPAAKAAGTVIQAIASIALGFAQASAQASSMGPWGWLAFLAAGTAAMATTISTVHSLTGYANGGIVHAANGWAGTVPGNSYSGDNIPILANAGEVVLNRAQQGNLASQLQGSEGGGGMRIVGVLKGHDMALMLDRWGMTTGRGELLFGKNL